MTTRDIFDPEALVEPIRQYLPRQRWYARSQVPQSVAVLAREVQNEGWPALVEVVVDADGARYQAVLGVRPAVHRPDCLRGRDDALLGEVESREGAVIVYDAVVDPELGLVMLDLVSGGAESADHVRPVGAEQSNSSLVYDDRLILKVFRRLHPGRNLEVEMTQALSDAGFSHVARPLAVFSRTYGDAYDLAVLQPFLLGGVDGWALALTSLRDLFGVGDTQPVPIISPDMPPPEVVDPGEAGGDFSAEAFRLGTITAEMHIGLADAFGAEPGQGRLWADTIEREVREVSSPPFDQASALEVTNALRSASDVGPAIRVHGDYHLGQVLRTDSGWYVLDFEGEPSRSPAERRRKLSPLRDVAGMFRSFHYASEVAQIERDEDCQELAAKWEHRNRDAFMEGYVETAGKAGMLPGEPGATEAVVAAFELEKAIYELRYEQGHRPDWEHIPAKALGRLVGAS